MALRKNARSEPWGIRARLTFAMAALLAVLLTASGAVFFLGERKVLLNKAEEAHWVLLAGLAQSCGDALVAKDPLAALNAVQAIRSDVIVEAACVDAQNRVAAHTDPRRLGAVFAWPPGSAADRGAPGLEARRWRENGRDFVGLLQRFPVGRGGSAAAALVFSQSALKRAVHHAQRGTARRLLWVLSAALLLGWTTALILARGFTGPIHALAEHAQRIGRGEFTTRLALHSSRELEGLGTVLNQTAEALGQLDQMKDEFIAMVSHDLRSPLGAIQSYAETLRDERRGPLNEEQKRYLGTVVESARSLNHLVTDVLDLAKVRAGRMEYRIETLLLAEVVGRVAGLLQALAEKQGAKLEISVPPELRVRADPQALERVITNLLSNALKVVPKEGGRVGLKGENEGRFVRLSVADNGPGISPEDQKRLFQKFNQLTAGPLSQRTRTVGTGLGLTLVKNLIEAQGGEVGLESKPGQGALFFFRLPKA